MIYGIAIVILVALYIIIDDSEWLLYKNLNCKPVSNTIQIKKAWICLLSWLFEIVLDL